MYKKQSVMNKFAFVTILAFGLMVVFYPFASFAQDEGEAGRTTNPGDNPRERRAQTTMKFLSVSLDAQVAAMGGAAMAQKIGASSMFYNPAAMARSDHMVNLSLGQVQWVGPFNYDYGSASFRPAAGRYGVFGLFARGGDYGNFIEAVRDPERASGYRELGKYSPTTFSAGVGYGRELNDQFSIGANIKYATQNLGTTLMNETGTRANNKEGAVVADFGMFYDTGFEGLSFAAAVRNFSQEVEYADKQVELPLLLQMGMSMNVINLTNLNPEMHSLRLAIDAMRPRDFTTNLRWGAEYTMMNTLALRAGYAYPQQSEKGVSLGAGLVVEVGGVAIGADYAYTSFGLFGTVNRFTVRSGF